MNILEKLNGATQEELNILTTKVDTATEEMGKINSKKEQIKVLKKDFTDNILTAVKEAFPNEELKREEKVLKGLFTKLIKCQTDVDSEDKDGVATAGYLRKKVEEMVMLIYAYRYLKDQSINRMFESYGIKLDYEPIENHLKYLAGTTFKESVTTYMDQAVQLQLANESTKNNIEETIYNEIPVTLKYNKNANPAGIKKSIFKKFSLLKWLKKINLVKAKHSYEKMAEAAQITDKANTLAVSIADTLVSDGNKEVI